MSREKSKQKFLDHTYCLNKFLVINKAVDLLLPKKTPLSELVTRKINNKEKTDITFVIGKKYYSCHGIVLRFFSELCGHYLPQGTLISLPSNKITHAAFVLIYEWMRRSTAHCPRGHLLDLLQAAHYLYVPQLVSSLFRCLSDKCSYSEVDAIYTYFEAKRKCKWGIAELMLTCVRKYFLLLVCSDEYRQIDVRCLCRLLESDSLAVQSEIEVLYAALYWVFYEYDERKQHLAQILQTVRFVLMSPRSLLSLAGRLHEMLPRVADELYPLLQLAMLKQQEISMGIFSDEDINARKRVWVVDPCCAYTQIQNKKHNVVSHIDFLNYLDKLDNAYKFLARLKEKKVDGFKMFV